MEQPDLSTDCNRKRQRQTYADVWTNKHVHQVCERNENRIRRQTDHKMQAFGRREDNWTSTCQANLFYAID